MWNGRTERVCAALLIATLAGAPALARQASPAEWTEGLERRLEQFTPEGRAPVELRFFLRTGAAETSERIVATTREALTLFDDWFGPFAHSSLTVIDARWRSVQAGTSSPGVVVVSSRWLAPDRDLALERSLLAAIGRQYWQDLPVPEGEGFREALASYAGTRAIHEALEGRNFATYRFFGGFVPFTVRSLLLSPNPLDRKPRLRVFDEIDADTPPSVSAETMEGRRQAQRAALALDTLERYLSWPVLQQGLREYREGLRSTAGPALALSTVVSAQRGRDIGWFFAEAFRVGGHFDYAVAAFTSTPTDGGSPFRTRVVIRRIGDGIFSGTSDPDEDSPLGMGSLPVAIGFEDGSEVRDWSDGREVESELAYDSASRAVWTSVDPEAFLLIDEDRENNSRMLSAPFHPTGARLAMHWLLWLQDAMLSYTGLL